MMSIFIPYSPIIVLNYFATLFDLDLNLLTTYETLVITILANLYFFIFWTIIIYFSLKIFNRIWKRIF